MPRPGLTLLLLAAAVVGGFLLVDALVVTDEEAVEALVDDAADAVRRGDFEAFAALLATEYAGEGGDQAGAVRRARRAAADADVEGLRATLLDLEVDGDRARGPVKVAGSFLGTSGAVSLDVGFLRTPEGWRIASARLTGVASGLSWGR